MIGQLRKLNNTFLLWHTLCRLKVSYQHYYNVEALFCTVPRWIWERRQSLIRNEWKEMVERVRYNMRGTEETNTLFSAGILFVNSYVMLSIPQADENWFWLECDLLRTAGSWTVSPVCKEWLHWWVLWVFPPHTEVTQWLSCMCKTHTCIVLLIYSLRKCAELSLGLHIQYLLWNMTIAYF